jgi:hypothetical protein
MTDRTHGQLVPDASNPEAGGVLYLRDGGGSSSPPSSSQPLVYCHVVGTDKQTDIYSCAFTAAEAVAEGPTSYRTIEPPSGCLKL